MSKIEPVLAEKMPGAEIDLMIMADLRVAPKVAMVSAKTGKPVASRLACTYCPFCGKRYPK